MAHLWLKSLQNATDWALLPFDRASIDLSLSSQRAYDAGESASLAHLLIVRGDDPLANGEKWVLIAPPNTTVNGAALSASIRLLRDKDEIRVPGRERMFFGAERLAKIQTFAGSTRAIVCPRCKQPVSDGAMSVRCPACGVVHHQTGELPCWLGYVDSGNPFHTCALCDQPAAVEPDARFRWSPEGL